MNSFFNAFSLYEFLRIIIPGIYFAYWLRILNIEIKLNCIIPLSESEFTIGLILVSIIFGVFIYSLNFPKHLLNNWLKISPTYRISTLHPEVKDKIENNFWDFYEDLDDSFKLNSEKFGALFHFIINITLISFFLLFISFLALIFSKSDCDYFKTCTFLIGFYFLLSLSGSYFMYKWRMKNIFDRVVEKYENSKFLKKLLGE
jgi:hypothetical protein